jgi:hypothetical protein
MAKHRPQHQYFTLCCTFTTTAWRLPDAAAVAMVAENVREMCA